MRRRTLDDVEIAASEWVGRFYDRCVPTGLGDVPPAHREAHRYRQKRASTTLDTTESSLTEPGAAQSNGPVKELSALKTDHRRTRLWHDR